MNDEKLREIVEKSILSHMEGMDKIISLEEVQKISVEHDMNLVGMINVLSTNLVHSVGYDSVKMEVVDKIDETIHSISDMLDKHPVDSAVILLKVLSDLIVQVTEFEKVKKENN